MILLIGSPEWCQSTSTLLRDRTTHSSRNAVIDASGTQASMDAILAKLQNTTTHIEMVMEVGDPLKGPAWLPNAAQERIIYFAQVVNDRLIENAAKKHNAQLVDCINRQAQRIKRQSARIYDLENGK